MYMRNQGRRDCYGKTTCPGRTADLDAFASTTLQMEKTKAPLEMMETREEKRKKEERSGLTISQNH